MGRCAHASVGQASAGEPNKLLVSLALPPQEKREPMSKAATELVQREFSSVATVLVELANPRRLPCEHVHARRFLLIDPIVEECCSRC